MAHHRLLHDNSAAIFSPSVRRIAVSTARDWSYVDSWLSSKFPDRKGLPPFERNQDTLKALLAVASWNEAADDQRRLLTRANTTALQQLAAHGPNDDLQIHNQAPPQMKDNLLGAIEHSLPKEGATALDVLAHMATEAGVAYPDPEHIGRTMVHLQGTIYENEQMTARIEALERQIQREVVAAGELLHTLQGDDYKPPSDLAKQNLDVQRKIKSMSAQLSDLHDRNAALASSINASHPSLDDVAREEQDYVALLARKRELDEQMAIFAGLPSDPNRARSELDALHRQLRGVISSRDAEFEGLVERQSPIKRR